MSYVIGFIGVYSYIRCLTCGLTSFNAHDIAQRYCGWCHRFHEDVTPDDQMVSAR